MTKLSAAADQFLPMHVALGRSRRTLTRVTGFFRNPLRKKSHLDTSIDAQSIKGWGWVAHYTVGTLGTQWFTRQTFRQTTLAKRGVNSCALCPLCKTHHSNPIPPSVTHKKYSFD
jgi:hypothetical protein